MYWSIKILKSYPILGGIISYCYYKFDKIAKKKKINEIKLRIHYFAFVATKP